MCLLAMIRTLLSARSIVPLGYVAIKELPAPSRTEGRSGVPAHAAAIVPASKSPTLESLVSQYEREPTPEAAAAVWASFSEAGDKVAKLKQRVAQTVGGVRAEAELERIELEHAYDAQLARFAAVHARLQAAHKALDALAAAADASSGIRAATTALIHGASPLVHGRVTGRDRSGWAPEQWDVQ
jgi:hypothetical protein